MALLEITNLHVALEGGPEIVKGVDLSVDLNQKHAMMGPNGSGKSTFAYALMGHPAYEVTEGQILLDGQDVTELGAVLTGDAPGRESDDEITTFDSTGLAIQDLAIALAAMERVSELDVPSVDL